MATSQQAASEASVIEPLSNASRRQNHRRAAVSRALDDYPELSLTANEDSASHLNWAAYRRRIGHIDRRHKNSHS